MVSNKELIESIMKLEKKVNYHFTISMWVILTLLGIMFVVPHIESTVPDFWQLGITILIVCLCLGFYILFKVRKEEK